MKSKNMTLMIVAIGCGLVAAFLTAKLSGGSGPEKVEVVVAKKELVVGTILEEKELDGLLATMKFDKSNLPPDVILNADELKGKRLNRTLKQGNYFSAGDVANDSGIKLPDGMSKYSIKMDGVKAVSGFVQAGDKVDVILTESMANGKAKSGIILRDMLVLAVDVNTGRREGGQQAVLQVNAVSLAVVPTQALILSSAEKRGEVKLLLRDPKDLQHGDVPTVVAIPGFEQDGATVPAGTPAVKTVTVIMARAEVPVNTFVTKDNFNDFFRAHEVPEEVAFSEKTLKDPNSVIGKYVTNKLEADMQLFKNWLSDNKVEGTNAVAVMPPPIDLDQLELLPIPREIVADKPLFPRKFEQIINNHRVFFIEMSPGEFRRLDGNGDDIKDLPSTGSPFKKEEKTEESHGDRPV